MAEEPIIANPKAGHSPPAGYNLAGPSGGTAACLYQEGSSYQNSGGYCSAVGVHVSTDNLVISNNQVGPLEQGFKFFEGTTYTPTNLTVNANDIFGTHRISLEAQENAGFTITNNDTHDMGLLGAASWTLSMPQGGPGFYNNNLLIQKRELRYG